MATRGRALQHKVVTDFSGGLNDTLVECLLKDNEGRTATNVFCNMRGGVEKRYGHTAQTLPSRLTYVNTTQARLMLYKDRTLNFNDELIYFVDRLGYTYRPLGSIATLSSSNWVLYTNGTATFTNGSPTVTLATGTQEWLTQIGAIDLINSAADSTNTWYTVSSVESNTSLTLTANYAGTTNTSVIAVRQVTNGISKASMFNGSLWYGSAAVGSANTSAVIRYSTGGVSRRFASPSAVNLRIFENHKNYLFAADPASSRVWWSALLGTTWPSTNFVDVSPDDGERIRALISHNGLLYIFRDQSIFYLSGEAFDPANPTYALVRIENPLKIGTFNGETVKAFQDKIVFLGPDGIYALAGVNQIVNLSEHKIRTTIRSIQQRHTGTVSTTLPEAAAIVYDNRYWLSVQTTASANNLVNDLTIIIEPNGSFVRDSRGWNNMVAGNDGTQLLFVGMDSLTWNANTMNGSQTNDGASAINSTYSTKVHTFGDFSRTTHVTSVYVAYYAGATGQAASLAVYDDSGQVGSTTAWTFPTGTTQNITVQRFAVDRDTNGLYLSVTDNTLASTFRLIGFIIEYEKDMEGSGVVVTS